MGIDIEHAASGVQTAETTPPSTASTSAPKTSMFGKKAGFVIPKNKLSGSLIPVYRGTKRGDAELMNEEATKQVQRRTKWGPDLTMDTTVRKGRALAYQTRINQISQQRTVGVLDLKDNDDLVTSESQSRKTSDHQLSHEELELLEHERREIIGELLKLNPTYKAPTDYKPLLKEAKVPIPAKEYPGYNFIGLVFGPSSDTQKRLEKETGAKIQVYGTKADSGVKVEITPADGKEIDNAYENMYVHISADTFEKVDAAVALIELLVTPVSANPVPSTSTSVPDNNVNTNTSQSTPTSIIAPALINQGTPRPSAPLPLPQAQFPQYPQGWFPAAPAQTASYPQSGLVTPANASAPVVGNAIHGSSSPFNPANMPSLFGLRPVIAASFSPVLQNSSAPPSGNHPPYIQQAPPLVQTGGPRNIPLPVLKSATAQPSLTGPPYNPRPAISISPQFAPVPASSDKPLIHGHNSMTSQNIASGGPLVNIPSQQSRGGFSPLLPSAVSGSSPSTVQPSPTGPVLPAMPQVAMRAPSANAAPGPAHMPFLIPSSAPPPNSFSGNVPNLDSMRPVSAAIPRPQQPSSNDFTFQPHRPPNAPSQPWQSNQAAPNIRHPVQAGPASLPPQPPLLRPMVHNLNRPPVQAFSRPQGGHQVNQPRTQIPTNFAGSPTGPIIPPRHNLILPGSAALPLQPRNFIPPRPIDNSLGPFPPRPGSQMHIQENHLAGPARPQRFPTPNQHFGNRPGRPPFLSSSGAQQIYDPFSPTSVSFNPQMGNNAVRVPGESDPEYEDLMASVGVK